MSLRPTLPSFIRARTQVGNQFLENSIHEKVHCFVSMQVFFFMISKNFPIFIGHFIYCKNYKMKYTGCPTKHDPHGFCFISLATKMLESWDIIHWKGGIRSFIGSTKIFLYDIREQRYKQIKIWYQILKCLNIGKSSVLKSDTAVIYTQCLQL